MKDELDWTIKRDPRGEDISEKSNIDQEIDKQNKLFKRAATVKTFLHKNTDLYASTQRRTAIQALQRKATVRIKNKSQNLEIIRHVAVLSEF